MNTRIKYADSKRCASFKNTKYDGKGILEKELEKSIKIEQLKKYIDKG